MSGVERVMYMDNIRTQALTETIGKEHNIMKSHFRKLEQEGKMPKPLTPPSMEQTMSELESTQMPQFLTTLMDDPEQKMLARMSSSMYAGSNPGYLLRDGVKTVSIAKKDYVWDQEEVDFMREQGELHKTHHMRKTDQSAYVEARARQKNLMKGPGAGGG
mmetsp:Transcript_31218/g.80125  ORF Transcript_31218/g.80125 Transcript_31218/m.80125 type:complete len:160 (-) Transcript_31218:22-501(-)